MLGTLVEIEKMVLESMYGLMETHIEGIFVRIWEKDKVRWFGMMVVHTMASGKEVYLMEKVLNIIIKLGIFKVNGEKARAGYFEDNVMISEEKQR